MDCNYNTDYGISAMSRKESFDAPARGWGRWGERGVPHKGWFCVDVEDVGKHYETCEMCERAEVRYVHVMRHPSYGGELRVGIKCAENMEQNYTAAKKREQDARNRSARRNRFPSLKGWRRSTNGNRYITLPDGFWVCVYRYRTGQFGFIYRKSRAADKEYGRGAYRTEEEAQLAAFDLHEERAQVKKDGSIPRLRDLTAAVP